MLKDTTQLELGFDVFDPVMTAEELSAFLNDNASTRVSLKLTRNRVTMMTMEWAKDGHIKLRLHEQYLAAPLSILRALRRYLRHRKKADWNIAAGYAQKIAPAIRITSKPRRLSPKGEVYDLARMAREVNATYFSKNVKYRIGWGRRAQASRRRRRSIRYGSYCPETREIRIHPALDSHDIPEAFVRYIVFHEMLHGVIPPKVTKGRTYFHPPEFSKQENRYPEIERMKKISEELLHRLA